MGAFSDRAILTAERLLSRYGETITITKYTGQSFDPSNGSVTETTSTYTVNGITSEFDKLEIDGETIKATDLLLIIENPISNTPQVGDSASFDGKTYRIMSVRTVRAQGSNIIYKLQIRL